MAVPPFKNQWRFYDTRQGTPVARDELRALPEDAKAAIADLMKRVRDGGDLFPREVLAIGDGLFELRVGIGNNEFRCYYFREGRFGQVLLAAHFVTKKTQKIPPTTMTIIKDRRADWKERKRLK